MRAPCVLVQAAWFWPFPNMRTEQKESPASSFAEVSARAEQTQAAGSKTKFEGDLSPEITALLTEISQADSNQKTELNQLQALADDTVHQMNSLGIDAEALTNRTQSFDQQTNQATAAVAKVNEGAVNLGETVQQDQQSSRDREAANTAGLVERATDALLRSKVEGQAKLQGFANTYASKKMQTQKAYDNFQYQSQMLTEKTDLRAKEQFDKYEAQVDKVEGKLEAMLDGEQTWVGKLQPANKEFEKYIKDSQKDVIKRNKELRKDIQKIDTSDKLMDMKGWEKTFATTNKDLEESISDFVEDTTEAHDDLLEEGEKHTKDFTKGAEKELKSFNKENDKSLKEQAKTIKSAQKTNEKLAKTLEKMEENLQNIAGQLQTDSSDYDRKVSEQAHDTETQIVEMNTDIAAKAASTLDDAVQNVDEAISDMASENSKTVAKFNSDQSKNIGEEGGFQTSAQDINLEVMKEVNGIAAVVNGAKAAADNTAEQTADTTARIEVQGLEATKIAEEAKKKATQHIYKMHQEVKALGDSQSMQLNDLGTDLDSIASGMKTMISAEPTVVSGPIESAAADTKRHLENEFSRASAVFDATNAKLYEQYKQVAHQMQQMDISPNGDIPDSAVGPEIKRWEDQLADLVSSKDHLAEQVEEGKNIMDKEISMAQTQLTASGRTEAEKLKQAKDKEVRLTEQHAFDTIGVLSRQITTEIGKAQSNAEAAKQADEYSRQRMDKMALDMNTIEKDYAEAEGALRTKQSETFQGLSAFTNANKAAITAAKEKIQGSMLESEDKQKEFLKSYVQDMLTSMSDNQQAQLRAITDYEDQILKMFDSSREVEENQLGGIIAWSENMGYNTINTTKTLEEAEARTADQAEADAQKAQLLKASAMGQEGQLTENLAQLKEAVDAAVDQAIVATNADASRAIENAKSKLKEQLFALLSNEEAVWGSAGTAIDQVNGDFATLQKVVKNTIMGYNDKADFLDEDLRERIAQMAEKIKSDEQLEDDDQQAFEAAAASAHNKMDSTDTRDRDLLNVMGEEVKAVGAESRSRMNEQMAKLDADAKAISGEITTGVESAEQIGKSAKQALDEGELELSASRYDLRQLMKSVDTALQQRVNETMRQAAMVQGLITTERDSTEKNTGYLRSYDLMQQSQVLALVEDMTGSMEQAGKAATSRLHDIEEAITEMKGSVSSLAETDTFSSLKKIMDADAYVQHASVENMDVVNYLNDFEGQEEDYVQKLVQALEDSWYAVLLHENEIKQEQEAIDQDTQGITGNVIAAITSMIDGEGGEHDSQLLENMSEGTLKMLLDKAKNGSEQDKKQVELFFKRIAAKGYEGIKHLKNAQAIMNAINGAAAGQGSYEMMKADLQRVVDYNTKLVEAERQRMEDRGLRLSDDLFFGSRDITTMRTPRGFEHVPLWLKNQYKQQARLNVQDSYNREMVTSLLQKSAQKLVQGSAAARKALALKAPKAQRLNSLLQQQEQLVTENSALAQEHKQISDAVRATANKIKTGKLAPVARQS